MPHRPWKTSRLHQRPARSVAVLVALVALLASCAPPAPPTPPTPTDSPAPALTLTFAATETRQATFALLIEAFNAQNSDLRVQFVPLAPGTPLAAAVRQADSVFGYTLAPTSPDVVLVRDLAPFIDADPTLQPDDFYPAAYQSGGQRLMLPLALSVPLLDYNTDLWLGQGLPPPDASWRWADLLAAVEQVSASGDDIAGLYDAGGRLTLQAELLGAGVTFNAGAALEQPAVVAAVSRVQALAERRVIDTGAQDAQTSVTERIRLGRLALWPADFTAAAEQNGVLPFTAARVPYPLLRDHLLVRPLGAMMSAGTQHPEATWRWLSFLSRQQVQAANDGSAGAVVVAARRSVASASGIWTTLEPAASGALQVLLERESPAGEWFDGDPALLAALEQALDRVLAEGVAPELALAEAQAALPVVASQIEPATSFTVATPVPAQADQLTVIRFAPNNAFGNVFGDPAKADFEEQNPGIVIEYVAAPDVGRSSPPYESVSASAAAADCFAWRGPPAPSEASTVVDLRTLIDAETNFPLDDYWPLALQPFEREGRLTGLPYAFGVPVLWYNPQAFDAAGLPYPANDWTIEDVFAAAETLTDDRQYGLADGGSPTLAFLLDNDKVGLTTGEGPLLRPRFTEPEVVEALERYVELVQGVTPFAGRYSYSNPLTMAEVMEFQRAAMLFGGDLVNWSTEEKLFEGYRVVLLRDTQPAQYSRSGALFISASSPYIDACWSWIKYLSESELTGRPSVFNGRRSLGLERLASPQVLPGADEAYAAYTQLMEQPRNPQSAANFLAEPVAPYWLFRALDRVLREDASLAGELAEAQFVTEQYLACVQGGEPAEACARQVDPTFAPWVFNL